MTIEILAGIAVEGAYPEGVQDGVMARHQRVSVEMT